MDAQPLAVRNQHPVQLTSLGAHARPARPLAGSDVEFSTDLAWTNLWLRPGQGQDRIELDGELLRITPRLRYGLGEGFEIGFALPFLHSGGGVLDGFVESWHDGFGLPQNERDNFDRDRFAVRVDRQTPSGLRTAWQLDQTTLAVQDAALEFAWFPVGAPRGAAVADQPFSFGLRLGVEAPLGDEDRGFGNGSFDTMVGFVAGYETERLALFAWGGHSFTKAPSIARDTGLRWRDPTMLGFGLEAAVAPSLSFLAQVEWETSLLDELDETHANRDQVLLWTGGRYAFSERSALEFSVGEDLVRSVSPDVTFAFGLRHRW